MKKVPLINALANALGARNRCLKSGNQDWVEKHHARLQRLAMVHLPSGSGFDKGSSLDFVKSTPDRLVFHTHFHHMDDNGFYCSWTEHEVIVTPSFEGSRINIRVIGKNYRDIKEVIGEIFHDCLTMEVDEYPNVPNCPTCKGEGIVKDPPESILGTATSGGNVVGSYDPSVVKPPFECPTCHGSGKKAA